MQQKKVAFFVTSLNSGGIENYLLRFLSFSREEIEATVYCKAGYFGDLEPEYRNLGVTLVSFKLNMFSVTDYYRLFSEFKKNKFDSVVDFTGNFAALPLWTAKKAGIDKRITFYRGSSNHFKEDFLRLKYNNFLNKIIPKVATSILSNSITALDFFFPLKWKNDSRFEVIYNGIDDSAFLNSNQNLRDVPDIPATAFVVGHVGRFNVAKNHETIIKVALALCKENSNNFFIFCGDKVQQAFDAVVKAENLEKQILFLGFRKDVIKVLNTLDCFYFPSITEGQPNALIEAMLVNLPFVASNIKPIMETVPSEYYHNLVSPLDNKAALHEINRIKNKNTSENTMAVSEYIKIKFNAQKLFSKFLAHL